MIARAATAATALVLALAGAAPAAAQDPKTVVGGGSFNTAPMLEAGSYRDSILAQETLFYAIDVAAGQAVRIQASIDADADTFDRSEIFFFAPVVWTPLRELKRLDVETAEGAERSLGSPEGRIDVVSSPARTLGEAGDDGIIYDGPGTWYVGFTAVYAQGDDPPRIEVPFSFALELVGEPIAEEPVEFEEPAVEPEPDPVPEPESESDDDGGGTGAGTLPLVALLGLAAGAAGGALLRARLARGDATA